MSMTEVPAGELHDNTDAVLRRVQDGEQITITVEGEPVAEVIPITTRQQGTLTFEELYRRLQNLPGEPDPTFAADMEWIRGEYTDEAPLPWDE